MFPARQLVGGVMRMFQASSKRLLSTKSAGVKVCFKTSEGDYEVPGQLGESLLDVVINNDVPLDGFGACEGTLACCTCHVILEQSHFNRLAKPDDEELDMLDLAPDLDDLSRLGCQVILSKEDKPGITVVVPSTVRDARCL
uniref:2Fe-2S ferredoxin-type domain-containing protein n=1 Tax=Steinernema glaseri TaxID=37863 RepID=A0A1I7YZK6_9BILA